MKAIFVYSIFAECQTFIYINRENEELILGVRIREVKRVESQFSLKYSYDTKGVRFDVYIEDESNSVYDIEMQTTLRAEIPKRARYYQGMIDLNMLFEGKAYNSLKESFVIFICLEDMFGWNLPVYTFRNRCEQNSEIYLEDGTTKVIINAAGNRAGLTPDMVALLDYLKYNKTESKLTERLQMAVKKSIARREWEAEFMTWELRKRGNI